MDLAFQFLSDIVLYIVGLYFPQQTHAHLGIVSAFTQSHSFLLDLFLYSSPVAYWAPINLGSSTLSVISFCLFILFMDFSRQECWGGLPIPSPVDHVLSEFSTMTRPSWVTLHSVPHSFTELDKAVVHAISLDSFLWFWFSFCLPSDGSWSSQGKNTEVVCHSTWTTFCPVDHILSQLSTKDPSFLGGLTQHGS